MGWDSDGLAVQADVPIAADAATLNKRPRLVQTQAKEGLGNACAAAEASEPMEVAQIAFSFVNDSLC